jgi:putative acetyltransferase
MATDHVIRKIRPEDNPAVARIIREVMTEFGAVGCGFSIEDAEVDAMYQAYPEPHSVFYVIESDRDIEGCGGVGPLAGAGPDVCELRKMYFLPGLRGSGLGTKLLARIIEDARSIGYRLCYLETLDTMEGARRLYRKFGFSFIDRPLGNTGHSGCNNYMTLEL